MLTADGYFRHRHFVSLLLREGLGFVVARVNVARDAMPGSLDQHTLDALPSLRCRRRR